MSAPTSSTSSSTPAIVSVGSFVLETWLESINCSQYLLLFKEHDIEEYDLIAQLDYSTLKELGVAKVGDLVRLERSLNELRISKLASASDTSVVEKEVKQPFAALPVAESFVDKIVNYQIEMPKYSNRSGTGGNDSYLSESENDTENSMKLSVTDGSSSLSSSSSANKFMKGEDDSSSADENLKHSLIKNHSTSTISSIESNDSTVATPQPLYSAAIECLAPVAYMDKHIAVFILQNGKIKKMNTEGCYNAESIKKKLLRRLNLKPAQHENYSTYFIDSNDNIHLMFDVELVSLVRSSDRVERNRIIFCRSSEDPSSEALSTSRAISTRFEENHKKSSSSKKKKGSEDEDKITPTKYLNVNTTTSSHNLRKNIKKKNSKEHHNNGTTTPPYARKNKFMKPLYEQRPPSELISSNLAEYFPETPSKELHQTIKNSVRYSVRMSRVYSRLSMISTSSRNSSIANFTNNLQNSPRTVGDVWMNNASELDEAVLGDDKEFMDIMSSYKRPKSRFIPSGAPPLPGKKPSSPSSLSVSSAGTADSGNSKRGTKKTPETPKRLSNKRLSVAINSGNNRDSRIELLDLSSADSETEIGGEEEDAESLMKDLEDQQSSLDTNTGPEHWLKGKRIGAGSFGVVYLGLNSFTGELMAVKQVEIPKVHELAVSTSAAAETLGGASSTAADSSDNGKGLAGSNAAEATLQSDTTLGSNDTIQRKDLKSDEDTPDGKAIAKKEKDHKQSMIDALQREMALLKELKHEKIVRYLGSSSDGSFLNIFLEYVPGGSITAMLNNYGPFKEPLIRNFTRQILIGLKYLHSKNIIHRDIKGGNILIDNNGGAKISDFGISKKIETSMQPKRASLQGSVYWMAPEVVRQVTNSEKSDVWSVGCLIIEMFTGKHPFPEFSQMQAIFRIGTHSIPEIPEICTEDCKDFLRKTFIVEYQKRPSAKELLSHPFLNSLIMSDQ